MKTLKITKVFRDRIQISCLTIKTGTSLRDLISNLDDMVWAGVLCSYEIEIL